MRRRRRRRDRPGRTSGDILRGNPGGAPWPFVEGSISVTASVLAANAVSKCEVCGIWPVIAFFRRLTEQEDGVIISGMALLFPTALIFYLEGKMVFSAFYETRRRYQEHQARRDALMEKMQRKARAEARKARAEAWEEGREAERSRQKRELAERGISLSPEAESALFGENDDRS